MDLNDLCEQIKDSFCTVVITGPDASNEPGKPIYGGMKNNPISYQSLIL